MSSTDLSINKCIHIVNDNGCLRQCKNNKVNGNMKYCQVHREGAPRYRYVTISMSSSETESDSESTDSGISNFSSEDDDNSYISSY